MAQVSTAFQDSSHSKGLALLHVLYFCFISFYFFYILFCSIFSPFLRCHSHDVHSSFMSVLCFLTQIVTCPRGTRFFTTSLGQGCRRSHPGPAQGQDSICNVLPAPSRLPHWEKTESPIMPPPCATGGENQVYPQLSSSIPGTKWSRRQNNKLVNAVADITGIA